MTENADKKVEKNPEVAEKAIRRRFTADYKRRIALEAERSTEPGEIGVWRPGVEGHDRATHHANEATSEIPTVLVRREYQSRRGEYA